MPHITQEKIRDRAYQLWEEAGRPEGQEQDFWYRAERELAEVAQVDISEATERLGFPPSVPDGFVR